MYLSPERREVFSSLRSLGLSKDPKDAQRQPYRFPDDYLCPSIVYCQWHVHPPDSESLLVL